MPRLLSHKVSLFGVASFPLSVCKNCLIVRRIVVGIMLSSTIEDNEAESFFRFLKNKPIFVDFVSKWVDIRDIARFDSALTNHKYRPVFLQCLEEMRNTTINGVHCSASLLSNFLGFMPPGMGQFLPGMMEMLEGFSNPSFLASPHALPFGRGRNPLYKTGHSKTLLSWISQRHIDVNSISLANFKGGEEALFIGSLQLSVRDLNVSGCSLRPIAQSCPLLEELTINESSMHDDGNLLTDLVFLCRHCTHLQKIRVKKLTLQSMALNDLQEFGHLFVEIDTHSREGLVTTPRFMAFLKRCLNLEIFSIFNIHNQKPSISDFTVITQLGALEELRIMDCGLTNEKLALICGCR